MTVSEMQYTLNIILGLKDDDEIEYTIEDLEVMIRAYKRAHE